MRRLLLTAVTLAALGGLAVAQDSPEQLAAQAQGIFATRCTKCHGKVNPQSGLSVLDWQFLTENGYVAPGKLNASELWTRVSSNDDVLLMPPTGPLPDTEKAIIQKWIESGAPRFVAAASERPIVTMKQVFHAVEADLRKYPPEDQRFLRYFSLAHLHNHPGVSDRDLRTFRAALSKLCNSLSWERDVILPVPVDEHQTVFRMHLVKIGWDRDHLWQRLLSYYPYGLTYDLHPDEEFRASASYVYSVSHTQLPVLRADWFIATACQPPLYEALLRLPTGEYADRALEARLNVDVYRDFIKDREQRAGFVHSGMSKYNRVVARHSSVYGAYWKAHSFGSSQNRHNLLQYALGPVFEDNEYAQYAYQHDGSELLFNLPNGLQGYMMVDARGYPIPRAPLTRLYDSREPVRNKDIVNGISCIACHATGVQPSVDELRILAAQRPAPVQRKIERLYPPKEEWDRLIKADQTRFLRAYEDACAEFLQVNEDQDVPLTKFPEPVGAIARQYLHDLDLTDAVAELGCTPEALKVILSEPAYRSLGLIDGRPLRRDVWEASPRGYSVYQTLAHRLQLGTQFRVPR